MNQKNIKIAKQLIKLAETLVQQDKQKVAFKTNLSEAQIESIIQDAVKNEPAPKMNFYLGGDGIIINDPYKYEITIQFEPQLFVTFTRQINDKGIQECKGKAHGQALGFFKKIFSKTSQSLVKKDFHKKLKELTLNVAKKYNEQHKGEWDNLINIYKDGSMKWSKPAFEECQQKLMKLAVDVYSPSYNGWMGVIMNFMVGNR